MAAFGPAGDNGGVSGPASPYETLEVTPEATPEEIKRAYHRLARRHHPDAHSGADPAVVEEARRRMAAINAAWAVLGDAERRRAYDAASARSGRPSVPTAPPAGSDYPPWFEPEEVPAADLDEDVATGRLRGRAQVVVFLPVAVVVMAVALFSFGVLSQSPRVFAASLALVPVAAVAFAVAPLVVMSERARRG